MLRLRLVAAALAAAAPVPAQAAQVMYGFIFNQEQLIYDPRDAATEMLARQRLSGNFTFETNTNSLLGFSFGPFGPSDYDPGPGFELSPYGATLALFNAAGPCDLACFIGVINTSTYSVSYVGGRIQLNFGAPLGGSVIGTNPGGVGRPSGAAGTLTVTGPIPEPSTWLLMLFGFVSVGLALGRRRKVSSPDLRSCTA